VHFDTISLCVLCLLRIKILFAFETLKRQSEDFLTSSSLHLNDHHHIYKHITGLNDKHLHHQGWCFQIDKLPQSFSLACTLACCCHRPVKRRLRWNMTASGCSPIFDRGPNPYMKGSTWYQVPGTALLNHFIIETDFGATVGQPPV